MTFLAGWVMYACHWVGKLRRGYRCLRAAQGQLRADVDLHLAAKKFRQDAEKSAAGLHLILTKLREH
jgi:hypothetical protein